MEGRTSCQLSFFSTWIFVFFCLSVCLGLKEPRKQIQSNLTESNFQINVTYLFGSFSAPAGF